jgi:thioredoxin-dependent peroxiredoxin
MSDQKDCVTALLHAGQSAPGFDLPDADMEMVSLAAFRKRKNVVLYFYVRDDTPSCTMEALEFSDNQDRFESLDTVILGVSMDDCLSHGSFRDKHGLSVQLLADVEGEVCGRYGVLHDKELNGAKKTCIQRSTFVIDKSGTLKRALYGVSARGHAADVLDFVKGMVKCK